MNCCLMKTYSRLIAVFLLFLVCHSAALMAQVGLLDNTFGNAGKVITRVRGNDLFGESVLVQPDGKIVVAGYLKNGGNKDFVVVRYLSNGSLDESFGINGFATTDFNGLDDYIMDVVLQTDGKLVVGGYIDSLGLNQKIGMARYTVDGKLDSTFGNDGKLAFKVLKNHYKPERLDDLLLQPDGKIVAVGKSSDDMVIIRLDSSGRYDSTFNGQGWNKISATHNLDAATCIALQPDGKLVAAGYVFYTQQSLFCVVRVTADGKLDNSFNSIGLTSFEVGAHGRGFPSGIAIQADGKIVLVGRTVVYYDSECAIVRLNSNGSFDKSFNGKGYLHHGMDNYAGYLSDVIIQADGKILAVGTAWKGSTTDLGLVRYTSNGTFDSTFNSTGFATLTMGKKSNLGTCFALQPDRKIVIAGGTMNDSNVYGIVVARYFSGMSSAVNQPFISNTSIFPNPASEWIHLNYTLTLPGPVSIQIIDSHGRDVLNICENRYMESGQHTADIDLQLLPQGIYTIRLKTQSTVQSFLIVHE